MATAFRIHEDTENVTEIRKEKKNFNLKNNGNDKEKRPTFAVLNNVAFDTRGTHAPKTVSDNITFSILYLYSRIIHIPIKLYFHSPSTFMFHEPKPCC